MGYPYGIFPVMPKSRRDGPLVAVGFNPPLISAVNLYKSISFAL